MSTAGVQLRGRALDQTLRALGSILTSAKDEISGN